MYSYKQFTPGKKSNARKIINYLSLTRDNSKICQCITEEYKKNTSNTIVSNISNSQRISQVINSSIGGSTQFGNYYLGEPVVFNYLGRVEGQPGGSGAPIRNRF
jgi:hypothetical protein